MSGGRTVSYEYDAEERITKVIDSVGGTTEYTYDALGQLLTETANGEAVNVMTYDNYGNILSKNGKAYAYGDKVWKDRLTAFDGKPITYDAQGNPVSYLGHTLTWEKGRQLKSFDNIKYTYNANGIRTSKTVNGVKHEYKLEGTKILWESWGGNTLIPLYDNEDGVCGILYDNVPYYFYKNLQGDVIAIADKDGEPVARYTYDAWGVCTVTLDISPCAISAVNPYRYRSYYYDAETGLYYLQSRYYDPVVGRFICADEASYLEANEIALGCNLFSYCENDPINDIDITGYLSLKSALSKIGNIINRILGKLWNYLKSLIKYNRAKRTLSISTTLISTAIDALIAMVINGLIYRGLKAGMRFLLKNNRIRNSFVNSMFNFFLNNKVGKVVLWTIVRIGFIIAGKAGAIGTITSNIFKGFLSDILTMKSKILQKASSLISAFSSIGGIIAFFLDIIDKRWDDYLTLKI